MTAATLALTRIYMSPVTGHGTRLTEATIRKRLKAYHLEDALDLCAYVAARADASVHDSGLQRSLLREFFPSCQAGRLITELGQDVRLVPFSSQVALNLALLVLQECPESDDVRAVAVDPTRFGELLMAVAGNMPQQSSATVHATIVELVRLGLWFEIATRAWWYELGYRLLFEVLPEMTDHPDWLDVHEIFTAEAGLPVDVFWALTAAHALASVEPPGHYRLPLRLDGGAVSEKHIAAWTAAWSRSVADSQQCAAHDLQAGTGWSFSAFYDRPLIALSDRTLLMRPQFLGLKVTPLGIREFGERCLSSSGGGINGWSRLCGAATELLARALIAEFAWDEPRLADEDEIRKRWGPGKACDTVFMGSEWIAIDFVFRRVSKATAVGGDLEDLAQDLERGVVKKLVQIDETLARGLRCESSDPPERVFPLVVVGVPMPVRGVTNVIDQLVDAQQPKVVGVDSRCAAPVVVGLAEFWEMLCVAGHRGIPVADVLRQWVDETQGAIGFHDWLTTSGPGAPEVPERRYESFVTRVLFGVDANGPSPLG